MTEGSNHSTVLVHLFEDALIQCQVMDEALRGVAARCKHLKCLRIKSTHAIENWPERNLPTLFVYAGGSLSTQLVTLSAVGGVTAKAEDLEWWLLKQGVISEADSDLTEDPRKSRQRFDDDDDDGGDGSGADSDGGRRRGNVKKIKFGAARRGLHDDDDSDD